METVFDWITIALFAALCVLFLQRSVMQQPNDRMLTYLPAAAGCALTNWLGNAGFIIPAVVLCMAVMVYIFYVLKPFARQS